MKNKIKKPILLCILDGWGIGDENDQHNAIAKANLKNYSRIIKKYPNSKLETSGLAVGLPEGQIGNSEVGHMTIGAGRVIFQDLPRINNAIKDGSINHNQYLIDLIKNLKNTNKTVHLLGLLSDGGVHSHQDHIIFLAKFLSENNVKVNIHAFLDGRDVAQKSAMDFINNFKESTKNHQNIILATISGRYYAMDRDKNWNRIKMTYDCILKGEEGETQKKMRINYDINNSSYKSSFDTAIAIIKASYNEGINDEFLLPFSLTESKINDGDAIISCNFRSDRIRQISTALIDVEFKEFPTDKINFSWALAMTEYSERLNNFYKILFPTIKIENSLPQIIDNQGLKQLRIAETEKYAHVTFFFSCGVEKEFSGEKRILIKSPAVATYDLKPEMSAFEVGDNLKSAINSDNFDFIIVNYANPDMVGHSGDLLASIKACQIIDLQLEILEKLILEKDGLLLISADHGNIECMIDSNNNPSTTHTQNPVPFILVGNNLEKIKLRDGNLSDIAPTILDLMGIDSPQEMTGKTLLL